MVRYLGPGSLIWVIPAKDSDLHTTCSIKGQASYFSLAVDGEVNEDAWYYPDPPDNMSKIKGHIAFYTTPAKVIEVFP